VKEFNNQGITSFNVGMNTLATRTPADYKVLLGHKTTMNNASMKSHALPSKREKKGGYPDSFDWRANGTVRVVKNQGFCGSGWALAAIGAQESMFAIYSK
jgi:C1A family cysteine protease